MSDAWAAVGAISTATASVVVVIAAIYAHYQLREARLSRNVSLLLAIHERYHSLPMRKVRARLLAGEFGTPEVFDLDSVALDDRLQLSQMLDDLQLLGLLVRRKLIDFELVHGAFPSTPPRVWKAVSLYAARRLKLNPKSSAFQNLKFLVSCYPV